MKYLKEKFIPKIKCHYKIFNIVASVLLIMPEICLIHFETRPLRNKKFKFMAINDIEPILRFKFSARKKRKIA